MEVYFLTFMETGKVPADMVSSEGLFQIWLLAASSHGGGRTERHILCPHMKKRWKGKGKEYLPCTSLLRSLIPFMRLNLLHWRLSFNI
jgi:hypothetical protein